MGEPGLRTMTFPSEEEMDQRWVPPVPGVKESLAQTDRLETWRWLMAACALAGRAGPDAQALGDQQILRLLDDQPPGIGRFHNRGISSRQNPPQKEGVAAPFDEALGVSDKQASTVKE